MALDKEYVMQTYGRLPIVLVKGEGARVWDSEGREYLDFLAGIAVCGLGHCHPKVTRAIQQQAETLLHVSNIFYNELQPQLAKQLAELTNMERVFFQNSGAEANECAIKIARKWGKAHGGPACSDIITFHGSFHGRTLATVTATAQEKYQAPFAPLPGGFKYAHVGDVAELDAMLDEHTCAVMIEPIQGESGVKPVPAEFLHAIRALCHESGILMICDEVQTGIGRTGRFLASQSVGVNPDIITLAKGVANGVPMGVCLARGEAASTLVPGDHGSTFGGQPLACAAALAVLDTLIEDNLMQNAACVGDYFRGELSKLSVEMPDKVKEARGIGLMVGLELSIPLAKAVLTNLLEQGIIANAIGDTVLRFLPPLIVTTKDCDRVVNAIRNALCNLS
jgi:predicted acetylornithine/succinylornithine family transaminase